jgi:tetratricopeptide (TPR) repeat protein
MLKDALGAYRGSVREISRLIDAEPDNAEAYFSRAGARCADGNSEGALGDYTMALKLGLRYRESIVAYGNRGMIRYDAGDYLGAADDFSEVIERRPKQKTLMKAALMKRAEAKEKLGDGDGAAADRRLARLLAPDYNTKQGE